MGHTGRQHSALLRSQRPQPDPENHHAPPGLQLHRRRAARYRDILPDRGARLLNHGGGTNGFTSNLAFLPDARLGTAILTNAQGNNLPIAVFARVLELAYGQPMEADARYAQRTAQTQQAVRDQLAQLPQQLDLAAVAPYQGLYTNPVLGVVTLALKGEKLMLDVGTFTSELRSAGNGTYLVWDPPLVGMYVKLTQDAAGQPGWELISEDPDQPGTYPFTRVQATRRSTSRSGRHPRRRARPAKCCRARRRGCLTCRARLC